MVISKFKCTLPGDVCGSSSPFWKSNHCKIILGIPLWHKNWPTGMLLTELLQNNQCSTINICCHINMRQKSTSHHLTKSNLYSRYSKLLSSTTISPLFKIDSVTLSSALSKITIELSSVLITSWFGQNYHSILLAHLSSLF